MVNVRRFGYIFNWIVWIVGTVDSLGRSREVCVGIEARVLGKFIANKLPRIIKLGHADLVVTDSGTVLFTSLDGLTRSRLSLQWK